MDCQVGDYREFRKVKTVELIWVEVESEVGDLGKERHMMLDKMYATLENEP